MWRWRWGLGWKSILKIHLSVLRSGDKSPMTREKGHLVGVSHDMETDGMDSEAGYRPHSGEEFMNARQLRWFEERLVEMRDEIIRTSVATLDGLRDTSLRDPDMTDRASNESDWTTELRTRDRQRKLLGKISYALLRIREGEYGYCEVTGEPIALDRLIARPTASMTISAQEAHERRERLNRAA